MIRTLLFSLFVITFVAGCSYTTKVTDGNTAVERKQYSVGIPMLKKEFNRAKLRSEKGKIALNLATSYEQTGQDEEAALWYDRAYNNGAGTDALKGKAAALKRLERYDEAIEAYTELGFEIGSRYEFRGEILGAEVARDWLAEEDKAYQVEAVDFNSRQADYAPVRYSNGQIIISSDRSESTGDDVYAWTGGGFSDLFLVDPKSGSVDSFDPTLNTTAHEGVPTFPASYNEVIFTRCDGAKKEDAYCSLYYSRKQGSAWSLAERLPFSEPGVNYLHPCLSEDGQTLYYAAKAEEGWGGYDIYVVEKGIDQNWGEPKLLSRSINTQGNEQFPFLDKDTLYFASDGHVGMGGLDIFKVYKFDNGAWSSPQNLKPPLNSGADDFGYTIVREATKEAGVIATGYFSSSRPGGQGGDDIYRYEERPLPPPPPIDETKPIVYKNILDLYVVEKIFADPTNPNSTVLGRRPIVNATVTIKVGGQERTVNTNEEGVLSLILGKDADYAFLAEEEGYLSKTSKFTSKGLSKDPNMPEKRYDLEIELDKIFKNQEIVLENIYYDFNESFIRDDAKPSLNKLVEILQINDKLVIEMGSHTDCRGRQNYNQDLSQRRAQAAVQYLIENGIEASRLLAKGYGAGEPAIDCLCARCTEEEHQTNRRTTFRILE
ncbi:MAG: OmpA family protein [Bacteroidota bacterium]